MERSSISRIIQRGGPMLPNFICPGVQKSATTTLFEILRQHPAIYLPSRKEVHFFDSDAAYQRGIRFYQSKYYPQTDAEIVGDITPNYIFSEECPSRIHRFLGSDIKLLFLLRDPVQRAYSHYWMNVRKGFERESFGETIRLEDKRCRESRRSRMVYSYTERGLYFRQIQRFLAYFPKDRMKFVLFEEFCADIPGTIREILVYLGVDPDVALNYFFESNPVSMPRHRLVNNLIYRWPTRKLLPGEFKNRIDRLNSVPFQKPPMAKETRDDLARIFADDINSLEEFLGRSLEGWRVNE